MINACDGAPLGDLDRNTWKVKDQSGYRDKRPPELSQHQAEQPLFAWFASKTLAGKMVPITFPGMFSILGTTLLSFPQHKFILSG